MIYQNVVVSWQDKTGKTVLRNQNKTIKEAMQIARFYGYKPPKWYEFWKPKARVITN